MSVRQQLERVYRCLFDRYGPQHWWPADEPFEVIVGAILTQSTAWVNVEKAIANLKAAGIMSPLALRQIPVDDLALYEPLARQVQALCRVVGHALPSEVGIRFHQQARNIRDKGGEALLLERQHRKR